VPVCLIHGCDDNVVPASESRQLHEKFQLLGATSRLILTPLISHGDSRRHLSDLPAAWQLAAGFAFFFKNASTDSRLPDNAR
ncbi:MAG TPA: alpha/beta hydrolase, partial [Leptospiraceae bacterium]|nr:alpha/beta hydrolase [Leptospiraceae bacterium]